MSESLYDPTIHLRQEPLQGYAFDHVAFCERLETLRANPTPKMAAWLKEHPMYPEFNLEAYAEYTGLSEPTLKKLKAGKTADPRGSTFWIFYDKLDILPKDVLKCIRGRACSGECAAQARMQLAAAQDKIRLLEAQIDEYAENQRRNDLHLGEVRSDFKLVRKTMYLERAALVIMCIVAAAAWLYVK